MNALPLCSGMMILLVAILGIVVLIRYLIYRDTINHAERGLSLPEVKRRQPFLQWGIAITILGLILTLGLYAIGSFAADSYPIHLGPWMLGGLIPLFLGLGLILIHYLVEEV
ncbi:MAG: hypothetical protein ACM3XO_15510 [Bacteroidota bacterium]